MWLLPTKRRKDRRVITQWRQYVRRSGASRSLRILPPVLLFYLACFIMLLLWGYPFQPTRGAAASTAAFCIIQLAVLFTLTLLFFVVDAIQLCRGLVDTLMYRPSRWPEGAVESLGRGKEYPEEIGRELLDIRFAAQLTHAVGKLVVYPFFILFLLIVSRLQLFDYWDVPWPLLFIFTVMFVSIIWASFALRNTAEKGRRRVLERLRDGLAEEIGRAAPNREAQYEQAIQEIRNERRGSFRPVAEDPVVRALLIPFGGVGGVVLIDHLSRLFSA